MLRRYRISRVEQLIKNSFAQYLTNHPSWIALSNGGELAGLFGIRRGEEELRKNQILETILKSITVFLKRTNKEVRVSVRGIDSSYRDLLSLDAAQVKSGKHIVPWLEWLLIRGDRTVVDGYVVETKNAPYKQSRSGLAIMVPVEGGFFVPPPYAGFEDNNMITQSVLKMEEDGIFRDIMVGELNYVLR